MIPDAYRRYRPFVVSAWVISVVLVVIAGGLSALHMAPHWVFVAVLSFGVFVVAAAYAKRYDAVLLELGEAGTDPDSDVSQPE